MRAIFHKQLRDAAAPCALLFVVTLLAFESGREFDLTRRPGMDGTAPFIAFAWGLTSVLLGFLSAAGDEARGLRQHLFHRGLQRGSIFLAQALADLAALAGALAVVIAVNAALVTLFHDPLAQPQPLFERYAELALLSTSAVLGRGLGVVGGLMRQAWIVRVFCTLYATSGAIYLTFVAMRELGEHWVPNEFVWLACTLGAGAALHVLAARMLRQGIDAERPLAGPLRPVFAVIALVIAAPATLLTLSQIQRWALENSVRSEPTLGISNGRWTTRIAAMPSVRDPLSADLFDAEQRNDIRLGADEARYYSVERQQRVLELGAGWRPLVTKPQRLRAARGFFLVETWIGARNGQVLVQATGLDLVPPRRTPFQDAPPQLELPYRRELSRSDGKPFSQKLVLLPPPEEHDAWLIADAADRTLWKFDLAPALPTLTQVAGAQAWSGIDVAIGRALAELEGPRSLRNSSRVALLTPSGRRSWNGSELVEAELDADEVWQSECADVQRFQVEVRDGDVLEPHVVVVDKRNELAPLEHRYRASLGMGVLAHLASVLRSPLGSIQSALDAQLRRPSTRHEWRDPLVAGGRRTWLLAINISVSLALALVFARRRALGLRAGWFALFALFGPLTALLAGALEPRRLVTPRPARAALRIATRPTRVQREAVVS